MENQLLELLWFAMFYLFVCYMIVIIAGIYIVGYIGVAKRKPKCTAYGITEEEIQTIIVEGFNKANLYVTHKEEPAIKKAASKLFDRLNNG